MQRLGRPVGTCRKKIRYQYYDKKYSQERIKHISEDPVNYLLCTCLDFAMKLLTGYDMNSRGNPELTNATHDRETHDFPKFASVEQQLHTLIKAAEQYRAAGHDMKAENLVKDQYKSLLKQSKKGLLNRFKDNSKKQLNMISQNRFFKNDNDPLTKMRMRQMVNAPKHQEPIKISTNINSESIFKVSGQHDNRFFKTTNFVNEHLSDVNDDQNNLMGI